MSDEKGVTKDFTLFSVAFIMVDGRQHAINARHLDCYAGEALERKPRIESIPWSELMGRQVMSVCFEDGHLILGLSTKDR